MTTQSQSLLDSNRFVVTAVDGSTNDPTQNVVTLKALVPSTNTNCVSVGQAYDLSDATLTSNAVSGGVTIPGGSFPIA